MVKRPALLTYVAFSVEFDDSSKGTYMIKTVDLRRGEHVAPLIVNEQRQAEGLPRKVVQSYSRCPD